MVSGLASSLVSSSTMPEDSRGSVLWICRHRDTVCPRHEASCVAVPLLDEMLDKYVYQRSAPAAEV